MGGKSDEQSEEPNQAQDVSKTYTSGISLWKKDQIFAFKAKKIREDTNRKVSEHLKIEAKRLKQLRTTYGR